MKKILSVLLLSLFTLLPMQVQGQFVSYNQIENGKYEAVIYYSSTTGQKSTYELAVTVTNDVVTAIHFGNGGSVHSGFNNEGYTYSGGQLSFSRDYHGNITGASTTVKVTYPNGTTQYFQIEL
jgi:hypothetical protein